MYYLDGLSYCFILSNTVSSDSRTVTQSAMGSIAYYFFENSAFELVALREPMNFGAVVMLVVQWLTFISGCEKYHGFRCSLIHIVAFCLDIPLILSIIIRNDLTEWNGLY